MKRFFFDMQRASILLFSVVFFVSVCSAAELNPGDIVVLNAGSGCNPSMVVKVDPVTGSQTIISQDGLMGGGPHTVFLDSRGDLIVSDRNFRLIRIKVADGSQSLINVFSSYIRGIAEEADGSLLLIELPDKLLRVDPDSGESEVVTSGNLLTNPFDLIVDMNGDIYLTNLFTFPTLVKIDPVTGNQETIFSSQFLSLYGIAFDLDGNLLVAENRTVGNSVDDDAVLWVNKSTGESAVLWQQGWAAIDVDVFSDGSLLIVDQGPLSGCSIECMLLRFDRTTNTTELITTGGFMSICQSALIVPESLRRPVDIDIKANGSDGPIIITATDTLTVTVSLDPGIHEGEIADWYIVAYTPSPAGWYHYHAPNSSWKPKFDASYRSPLVELSSYTVWEKSGLPVGEYTFFFYIGMSDGKLYSDSVKVNVQ